MTLSLRTRFLPRIIAIAGILIISSIGGILAACDFNVEITDEKRSLEKVVGTPRCESDQRVSIGSSGQHRMRIFLIDDQQENPEALELNGIDQEPFNLTIAKFKVATTQDHPSANIEVLNAEDGTKIDDATATIEIVNDPLVVEHNPRHTALKNITGNRRVPRAVYLLVDMSETAADQDTNVSRTSAVGTWILENFNSDSTRGDIDVFASLLMRNDLVSSSDVMFRNWEPPEDHYVGSRGFRGFVYTTEDVKDRISKTFTNTTNSQVSGSPPIYSAIEAAAAELRNTASEESDLLFNPSIIAISLERDSFLLGKAAADKMADATRALRGKGFPDTSNLETADFIPLQTIVYPRPDKTSIQQWDAHLDNLCTLAQTGGSSRLIYWGNVFHVIPSPRRDAYQGNLKNQLDMAYHAMKGYIELKLKYSLTGNGIQPGKRYIISFKLQGKLLDQTSSVGANIPRINFVVEIPN
jgi:hypothetical protein